MEPGGVGRSFREGSRSPEESANGKPGDVPQGHALSLSLTVLLQDEGGGVCEGPESDMQEDSDGVFAFLRF